MLYFSVTAEMYNNLSFHSILNSTNAASAQMYVKYVVQTSRDKEICVKDTSRMFFLDSTFLMVDCFLNTCRLKTRQKLS